MSGSEIPVITVVGDAAERGRQYGEQARSRIEGSVEIYLPAFEQRGLAWDKVREIARRFADRMADYDAELVAEIEGIASGAGLDTEHVVALNARTELLFWQDDGCTGVCVLPEMSADQHTLLAQNWDWRPECRDTVVLLDVRPSSGPGFRTFVEAGLLARSGVNDAGIGVTGNFLQSHEDFGGNGVPIPLIRRRILTSPSLGDAIGEVVRAPRAFSSNHLIGHAPGEAIDAESAPSDVFFVEPSDGMLVHSNHFLSPVALSRLRDTGIARFPDTMYRHRRLERLLKRDAPTITVDHVKDALRDHYGLPSSVCRHPAPRPDGTVIATVASVVMDLNTRHMALTAGCPCENDYIEHRPEEVSDAVR